MLLLFIFNIVINSIINHEKRKMNGWVELTQFCRAVNLQVVTTNYRVALEPHSECCVLRNGGEAAVKAKTQPLHCPKQSW